MTLQDQYRRIRAEHPTITAALALRWARHELAVEAIERDIEWTEPEPSYGRFGASSGPFAVGTLPDGAAIAVYWDDEPYDWGDCEPTEYERANLSVIGVAARANGEDLDSIWGYGFIDGTAEREAISCALGCGMFDASRLEMSERAHWAARDVPTVD
jgi:hypothetical protein